MAERDESARRTADLASLLEAGFPGWACLLAIAGVVLLAFGRLAGVLQWLAFLVAIGIPAGIAAGIGHCLLQFARGERW